MAEWEIERYEVINGTSNEFSECVDDLLFANTYNLNCRWVIQILKISDC